MVFRPLLLGASLSVAMLAAGACGSSYGADAPPPDGGSDATQEAPVQVDAPSETSTDEDAPSNGFTVLASGRLELTGIAATETTVYFIERAGVAVRVVPIEGGVVADLALADFASGVAVSGSDIFWSNLGNGTLSRATQAGAITTVTTTPGKAPAALAASVDRLVVAARGAATGEIQQYGLDLVAGTSVATSNNPWDVAVSAGGDIFWTDSVGSIWKGQTGGGVAVEVATGENGCQSIAADSSGVYWARPSDGVIRAILSGEGVKTLATVEKTPTSIAADASGLYWLTADGKLRRSSRNELPLKTIAQGFMGVPADLRIKGIALTSKYVVWLTSDGNVLRIDK